MGISKALAGLFKNVKKPWEITGLTSTVDYLEYLPGATEYRRNSPGSQPVDAIIPHDAPGLVYNTRYYVRDYRRNNKYTARSVDKTPLDVQKMVSSLPLTPEDIKFTAGPRTVRSRGT